MVFIHLNGSLGWHIVYHPNNGGFLRVKGGTYLNIYTQTGRINQDSLSKWKNHPSFSRLQVHPSLWTQKVSWLWTLTNISRQPASVEPISHVEVPKIWNGHNHNVKAFSLILNLNPLLGFHINLASVRAILVTWFFNSFECLAPAFLWKCVDENCCMKQASLPTNFNSWHWLAYIFPWKNSTFPKIMLL